MTDKWTLLDLTIPSREKIELLEAGPQTDALIACHVFGRTSVRLWNGAWLQDQLEDNSGRTVPPYSKDTTYATAVRYAPCPTPLPGHFVEDTGQDGPTRFTVSFGWSRFGDRSGGWFAAATAPTEALAVCRARLLASRIEQDREADAEVERWLDMNGLTHDLGGEG